MIDLCANRSAGLVRMLALHWEPLRTDHRFDLIMLSRRLLCDRRTDRPGPGMSPEDLARCVLVGVAPAAFVNVAFDRLPATEQPN